MLNPLNASLKRKSWPHHFADFVARAHSPGIIIVPQTVPIACVADDLHLIWLATDADAWHNRIRFLPL